jgi:hypothetical protein
MFKFGRRKKNTVAGVTLPDLPTPVDDNMYLAAASEAAFKDRASGAYDEYLFVENGITKMPFEEALESHLSLVSERLKSQYVREVSKPKIEMINLQGELDANEKSIALAEKFVDNLNNKLADQTAILNGEKTGRAGLDWESSIPEITTRASIRRRFWTNRLVYAFVGIADIGIIIFSLMNIRLGFYEAIIFTIPAVGIQVAFPHFAGDRLGLILHGSKHRIANTIEMVILVGGWMIFSFAITQVRMSFIEGRIRNLDPNLDMAIRVAMFMMLIGLGSWILFKSARRNPHENEYLHVSFDLQKAESKLLKLQSDRDRIKAQTPALEAAIATADESYREAIETAKKELILAAKSVYRRALVNQVGIPTFTASYIGEASEKTPRKAASNPRENGNA